VIRYHAHIYASDVPLVSFPLETLNKSISTGLAAGFSVVIASGVDDSKPAVILNALN
jgi:hypothetical protein